MRSCNTSYCCCYKQPGKSQNCEPLESRHSVGFLKTDEGRSCLVETSLKFINVVSNVNKSQCQAQILTLMSIADWFQYF